MKTIKTLTMLTTLLVLVSAIPTIAQIDNSMTFTAPFEFYAGNAKMPAGSYTVTQPDINAQLLLIESAAGSHSAFVEYVQAGSHAPASKSEITFNKYGKTDFLSTISVQGQESGMQVLTSKVEENAAKAATAVKHAVSAGAMKHSVLAKRSR
jgi:hypothetical protein